MKIESLKIENIRGYQSETEISFNDLTLLIGQNDIGKSTILEALDVFFENSKLDKDDVNLIAQKNKLSPCITVIFSGIPKELDLDSGAKTNLKSEYLLNSDGLLEIKKDYSTLSKPKTLIICNHPSDEKTNDLHSLTITKLRARATELKVAGDFNASIKNDIRKAIWSNFGDQLTLQTLELDISSDGVKDIWTKLSPELPLFALFQSDRKNDEKDKEIQSPLKFAAERALKKHSDALKKIQDEVEKDLREISDATIAKLKEMNPDVASELTPVFPENLRWSSLFSPTITSDSIPMNKRGSGVRRLLLINFFRAEADRLKKERNSPNIIYAIEEPETSQHPDWQVKLVSALEEISNDDTAQVIVTTHSPSLASMIPVENLRFIEKTSSNLSVSVGTEDNLERIANTLGVLPNLKPELDNVKVFLCLEGPLDIEFFNNLCPLFDIDLKNDARVVAISLGGGTLGHWVTNDYLKKLNRPEVHIYDKDADSKYQEHVNTINSRGEDHFATLTSKREIENYLHEDIIINGFSSNDGFTIEFQMDDSFDSINEIAKRRHAKREPEKTWTDQPSRYKDKCTSFVKKHLNTEISKALTIELLEKRNAKEEVEGWMNELKKRIE